MNMRIHGIDTDAGLMLYEFETDIYIAVLRSFIRNATDIVSVLSSVNVAGMSLTDYAINVHGLKSICANIGATDAKLASQHMENMAKNGNLLGILAVNDAFLAEINTLIGNIMSFLSEFDRSSGKLIVDAPDGNVLAALRRSCKEYDMQGIDEAMDMLESVIYETNALSIQQLRDYIDTSMFEEAIELIDMINVGMVNE